MKQDNTNTRELALKWWADQSNEYKVMQFRQYQKDNFTPATNFGLLTGREIERIYFNIKLSEKAIKEQGKEEVDLLEGITQGEWMVSTNKRTKNIYGQTSVDIDTDGEFTGIISIWYDSKIYKERKEAEANARLISQAPRLAKENKQLKEQVERLKKIEAGFYMNICRAYNAGKQSMNNQHEAARNGDPGGAKVCL